MFKSRSARVMFDTAYCELRGDASQERFLDLPLHCA